jgi:hypothetical protein
LVPEVDLSYRPFSWAWDPAEDLDPVKTANANMIKLSSGQTSIQRMFADQGLDWEVEQQQQAESLGITLVEFRKLLTQKFFGALAEKDPRLDKLEARRRKQKRAGLWPKWLGV